MRGLLPFYPAGGKASSLGAVCLAACRPSCLLVPGGRLRMRSLQLVLCSAWDFVDESVVMEWSPSNQEDLLWWSDTSNLLLGVSLEEVRPDLLFWSDASDQGWGAHLQDHFVSGLWSPAERSLSINRQKLCAICLRVFHF